MRINISDGKINYSQRNNKFYMSITGDLGTSEMKANYMCNVTSYVAGLANLGYEFPAGKYDQEEDNFCDFICHDEECKAFYKKNHPKEYDQWIRGKPNSRWVNEWHDCLAFGANKWMGKEVGKFYENLPLRDFFQALYEGHPMVTSMTFGKLGHIVLFVGFQNGLNETEFKKYLQGRFTMPLDTTMIFDDPFGYCYDFEKGLYKAETGNDRTMTLGQFIAYSKPLREEKVMCHILS